MNQVNIFSTDILSTLDTTFIFYITLHKNVTSALKGWEVMINYQMTHRNYEATLGHQSWGIVFLKSSHKINFPFLVDPSIDRNIWKEEYL